MSLDTLRLIIVMQPLGVAACCIGFGFSLGYLVRDVAVFRSRQAA